MKTQTETAPVTKSALMAMDWEQFAAFADANGWSTGSPERMAATIDLMIDAVFAGPWSCRAIAFVTHATPNDTA